MNVASAIGLSCIVVALAGSSPARAEGHHWSYGKHGGPAEWGQLDPAFASCQLGKLQSPVDIRDAKAADLPAIKFDDKPAPLEVIDNGHTIQVNYALDKGEDNPTVDAIWSHLPKQKEKEFAAPVMIDAATLLPGDKGYYPFQGSLITPPCSEGVRWFVLKTPMTVAASELGAFARLYPMNARPTQPVNGRTVEATR